MPCKYFLGQVKNKNETIWAYSEKFACQILNFFKMSISGPFFFSIDPYSSFYALFVANLVSHNSFFLYRPKTQNAHGEAEGFQQKRTAPPGVDAAETVRFSWKVVEPQGQREHDVRVSQAMPAWLFVHMDGNVKAAPS